MQRMLRINISRLCVESAGMVLQALGSKSIVCSFDAPNAAISLPDETDSRLVKEVINEALAKSPAKNDYLIVDNTDDDTQMSILRQGDIEEVGLYLCSLCAMIFGSKEEKTVHERSHLFGFAF